MSAEPLGPRSGEPMDARPQPLAAEDGQRLEFERLDRVYAALGLITQAIIRLPSREVLFRRVCEILVDTAGFRMAWIGWEDPESHRLIPVASAGDVDGYLGTIAVYTDDRPEGRGPAGTAFRTGAPYVANDLLGTPAAATWHAAMAARGFRSSAALPVREAGVVGGMLNVYAGEVGYFREREVSLLSGAAADVSFALDNLAREAARRAAEARVVQERNFAEAVLASLPGIFYLYDGEGRFLRWNRALESVTGYDAQEIARMRPLDFFCPEAHERVAEAVERVLSRGQSTVEAPIRTRDGRDVPYYFSGVRTTIDGRTCVIGIGQDVSEQRATQQALRELNETLEQKVALRTQELASALVRAESADRLKSAFLATMSHELRTPLNSIIGFTGIILQGLAGPLTPEQTKQLGMVQSSSRHLLELINDVLDLSKIEAGQLTVRSDAVDLRETILHASDLVRPLGERKGLTLAVSVSGDVGLVTGDRRRIEQILVNLLNNAVKFTDRGAVKVVADRPPGARLWAEGPPGPAVRVRVSDTGIGIHADDLPTLFRPFRQIDTGLARQHEGTGLGLAICKRLTQLLGGELQVTSEPGVGSTFTLLLRPRSDTP